MPSATEALAILVGALSSFVLGGLWYHPRLLGAQWMELTGRSEEPVCIRCVIQTFGGALVASLVSTAALVGVLQANPTIGDGADWGLRIGLMWVATSFATNYLFERRPFRLYLINAGYHLVQLTLAGAVVAAII